MRGRLRESELVEVPPHRAEIRFSLGACCPLPARGARNATPLGNRSKYQKRHTSAGPGRDIFGAAQVETLCYERHSWPDQ